MKKGLPFRDAYRVSGRLVAYCIEHGQTLESLPVETYREFSPLFDEDVYDAVDLDMRPKTFTLQVGAIVWATGWNPYNPGKIENLKFESSKAIINNMMMERLAAPNGPTGGKILRPGDGKEPQSFAFVQCAGSRDENHLAHCSYICCMASLKQISYIREQYPEAKIYVFYIDLRTPGKYEHFRAKFMNDPNTVFIKGKVADILPPEASDTAFGLAMSGYQAQGGEAQ